MDRVVKGIVMEVNKGNAVIMTGDGEFLKVKKPSYSINTGEEITSTVLRDKHMNSIFKYAAVAALIILLIMPALYIKEAYATVAYVNVDINPSLELGIDKNSKVNSVSSLNKDAEALLKDVSLKGLYINDALDKVITAAKEKGYIKDDAQNNVEIALVKVKDADIGVTQDSLKDCAEQVLEDLKVDASLEIHATDKKVHDDAVKENMSTNKYIDKTQGNNDKNTVKTDIKKSTASDKDKKNNDVKDTAPSSSNDNKDKPKDNSQNNKNNGDDHGSSKKDNQPDKSHDNNGNKDNGNGKNK